MPSRSPYVRPPAPSLDPTYQRILQSYALTLEAENKSSRTIQTYLESLTRFGEYLATQQLPQDLPLIRQEHIQAFIADLLEHYSPNTAHNRFRALKTFFLWCVAEGELEASPMPRTAPHVPEQPVGALTGEQIDLLRKACRGTDFTSRRDDAMLIVLYDTGLRRAELAGLTLEDVDLRHKCLAVLGKGGSRRLVPIGRVAAQALDRYERVRARHPHHTSHAYWVGANGPMTGSGIYQVVRDRAAQAGLNGVYTHLFRHTASHEWKRAGGSESAQRHLMGWSEHSPMPGRYGKALEAERAREEHARLSPADRRWGG